MTDAIFVKPREGARVRQPERNSAVMPDEGAFVPPTDYYRRLIDSGDLIEAEPPARPVPKAEPKPSPRTPRAAASEE